MPQLELGNLTTREGRIAFVIEMKAVMAWPCDAEMRKECVVAQSAVLLNDYRGGDLERLFERSGGILALAQARPVQAIDELLRKHLDGWLVAHFMLQLLFRLAKCDQIVPDQASVNKAAYMIAAQRDQFRSQDAFEATPKSRDDIVKVWSRHRTVAHLCTAFVGSLIQAKDAAEFDRMLYDDLETLLFVARQYQAWGTKFIPRRSKEPLIPADAWLLPRWTAINPVPLVYCELTDQEIDLLRQYRAPQPMQ